MFIHGRTTFIMCSSVSPPKTKSNQKYNWNNINQCGRWWCETFTMNFKVAAESLLFWRNGSEFGGATAGTAFARGGRRVVKQWSRSGFRTYEDDPTLMVKIGRGESERRWLSWRRGGVMEKKKRAYNGGCFTIEAERSLIWVLYDGRISVKLMRVDCCWWRKREESGCLKDDIFR